MTCNKYAKKTLLQNIHVIGIFIYLCEILKFPFFIFSNNGVQCA